MNDQPDDGTPAPEPPLPDEAPTRSKGKGATLDEAALHIVPLGTIVGLHATIEETLESLDLPPFRFPLRYLEKDPHFTDWLASQPIAVTRVRRRLHCIGNVRIFQLMRAVLDPTYEIVCIERQRVPQKGLQQNLIAELIFFPALASLRGKDFPSLLRALQRAEQQGLWSPLQPFDTHLAGLLGIDVRRLRKPRYRPPGADAPAPDVTAANASVGESGTDG